MPLSMRIAGRVTSLELEGARKAARIDFSKDPNIVNGVFHDLKVYLPSDGVLVPADVYLGQDVICEFQFVVFDADTPRQ